MDMQARQMAANKISGKVVALMVIDNARPLVLAIVNAVRLLDSCSDDELNPDVAVRGLEDIAFSVNQLAGRDRLAFCAELEEIAAASRDPDYAAFVREVPRLLGLSE